MKKILCSLLAMVMALSLCVVPVMAEGTATDAEPTYEVGTTFIVTEGERIGIGCNFSENGKGIAVDAGESVVLELYSGEKLLMTATLKEGVDAPGTCTFYLQKDSSSWVFTKDYLAPNHVPTKIVLKVNDTEVASTTAIAMTEGGQTPLTDEVWAQMLENAGVEKNAYITSFATAVGGRPVDGEEKPGIGFQFTGYFNESVKVEFYSGETILSVLTLNNSAVDAFKGKHGDVSGTFMGKPEYQGSSWTQENKQNTFYADVLPTTAKLYLDGETAVKEVPVSYEVTGPITSEQWGAIIETDKVKPAGTIIRAYLNEDLGGITVDMENVTFNDNESVQLKLYSGSEELTTATLTGLAAGTHDELTGFIGVSGTDDWWPNTEWTPSDNIVPDKIELVIDGQVVSTINEFYTANPDKGGELMGADDWKKFPGTAEPAPTPSTPSTPSYPSTGDGYTGIRGEDEEVKEEVCVSEQKHYIVLCRKLNVRQGAGTNYDKVGSLSRNAIVHGKDAGNGWVEIEYDGEKAYVSGQYVAVYSECECDDVVTVICRKLNVREGAGTNYDKIGSVTRGEELHVVDEADGWYKILYNGGYGWVCGAYVSK